MLFEIWNETLLGAVALVEYHEPEIRDIAAVLERKKRISRTASPVEKILARREARGRSIGGLCRSAVCALARKIDDALSTDGFSAGRSRYDYLRLPPVGGQRLRQ